MHDLVELEQAPCFALLHVRPPQSVFEEQLLSEQLPFVTLMQE
jgi:hypothetical protein